MTFQNLIFLESAGELLLLTDHGHSWRLLLLRLHRLEIGCHIDSLSPFRPDHIYVSPGDQLAFVDISKRRASGKPILIEHMISTLVNAWNERIASHRAQT